MEKIFCMADACPKQHVFEYGLRYHYEEELGVRHGLVTPKRFYLKRDEDPSGISGTGYIAEGVQWTDKSVTLRWRGHMSSLVHYKRMEDAVAVHGHNGLTQVKWVD